MVSVSGASPDLARYRAEPGEGFDGVVRIDVDIDGDGDADVFGTGSLLPTGRHILTAAHVVAEADQDAGPDNFFAFPADQITVRFETTAGIEGIGAESLAFHPETAALFNPNAVTEPLNFTYDMVVIELAEPAPFETDRYRLYKDVDEAGQDITVVGYGIGATGDSGVVNQGLSIRRFGQNTVEIAGGFGNPDTYTTDTYFIREGAEALFIESYSGVTAFSSPYTEEALERFEQSPDFSPSLFIDFDSGEGLDPMLAGYLSVIEDPEGFEDFVLNEAPDFGDPGLGLNEATATPGDSGGPALTEDFRIMGVSAAISFFDPDDALDPTLTGRFGQVNSYERVSTSADWIESTYFDDDEGVSLFVNRLNGGFFLTDSDFERDFILENLPHFAYDGDPFETVDADTPEALPVFRFYNLETNTHFFTIDPEESETIQTLDIPFRYEGVGFYAFDEAGEERVGVHRFWDFEERIHIFTVNEEDAALLAADARYRDEGIEFWGSGDPDEVDSIVTYADSEFGMV